MPTMVCQNLVSCFETQLTETTTTLKLKLTAPPLPAALDLCRNLEFGNWGFLHTNPKELADKDFYYAHPLPKNSPFSKLSPKSLQLCTENLGSETGSDTISDCSSIFSSSPPLSPAANPVGDHQKVVLDDFNLKKTAPKIARTDEGSKKINNFPPPLTTMSGASPLQVRRHTEGGRLIIEAVEGPFRNSYLHAERTNGRLKLSFATASASSSSSGGEQEEEIEEECGCDAAEEEEIENPSKELESEKEDFNGEISLMEKFQRLSRCKESGHGNEGLCSNWKPALWVATS